MTKKPILKVHAALSTFVVKDNLSNNTFGKIMGQIQINTEYAAFKHYM